MLTARLLTTSNALIGPVLFRMEERLLYAVYRKVLPPGRHQNRGKPTNHVEPMNLTARRTALRQRVAPLVRWTLSFAKPMQALIQRLAFFFNHYNHTTL